MKYRGKRFKFNFHQIQYQEKIKLHPKNNKNLFRTRIELNCLLRYGGVTIRTKLVR